jgi:hypothetical protein
MHPIWFIARIAGLAFLTAAAATYVARKSLPTGPDLTAAAVHFGKSLEEFGKGLSSIFVGTRRPSPDEARKAREETRITIE